MSINAVLRSKEVIQQWILPNQKVSLVKDWDGIRVFVETDKIFKEVRWIEGVPLAGYKNPEKYQAYFADTFVQLTTLSDGELKLVITPRLRGGMNNPVDNRVQRQNPVQEGLTRKVIKKLRKAMEFARTARGKDCFALIGPTGSGKSTVANHMLGKSLVPVRIPGAGRRLEVDGEQIAAISHSGTESRTLYAQTYPLPNHQNRAIVDCGGFYDSRGVSTEVAVVTSMKLTLEAARSAKLALCCMHASLSLDRATHLVRMVTDLLSQVLTNNRSYNSMLVLITRPVIEDPTNPPTTESIIEEFQYLLDGTEDEGLRRIFEFILRDNGRYILLYDPLNPQCRDQLNQMLEQLAPLDANSFNPAYSGAAALTIFQEIVSIAARGNQLFNDYSLNSNARTAAREQMGRLTERSNRFRGLIAQLNQGNAIDPATLRQQREATRTAQQAIIDGAEARKNELKASLDLEIANKAALVQKMELLGARDNEEGLTWEDKIVQEGKKITYTVSKVKKKKNKLGGVAGSVVGGLTQGLGGMLIGGVAGEYLPTGTKVTIEGENHILEIPIEHDFNYSLGRPIVRIEKVPADGPCWSDAVGGEGKNQFSIKYKTEPGAAANASIKVFGKRKDMPDVIQEKLGRQQEMSVIEGKINQLNIQSQQQDGLINSARIEIGSINHQLDNLTFYQAQFDEVEQERTGIQRTIDQLELAKVRLATSIELDEPKFRFLIEYRDLSRDQRLNRNDVQECIAKFQAYVPEENE